MAAAATVKAQAIRAMAPDLGAKLAASAIANQVANAITIDFILPLGMDDLLERRYGFTVLTTDKRALLSDHPMLAIDRAVMRNIFRSLVKPDKTHIKTLCLGAASYEIQTYFPNHHIKFLCSSHNLVSITMPYNGWSQRARLASNQAWFATDDFFTLQRTLQVLNFSVVADRTAAIAAVRAFQAAGGYPFSITTRVPENADYLSTFLSPELTVLLTDIVSYASYRDMQKDSTDKTARPGAQSVDSAKDVQVGLHYNDAARGFQVAQRRMQEYIFNTNNVFERADIERKLAITWAAAAP